ncbi:MAG: TetR family transcriptional regulator [Sciscionella sp.]|nr:TetR family transcriptional regulator [Sciscionella sp.]
MAAPTSAANRERTHRTQAERSEATRTALLDATIDGIVDLGYARCSVNEICKRAGVSRGAQQHHFATKAELTAAAIEHLTLRLRTEMLAKLRDQPAGKERVERAVELIWEGFSGKLSTAALELWVAARTDPELRAAMRPVDRALGRSTIDWYLASTGDEISPERARTLYWLTINLMRGLALDVQIGGDAKRRKHLLAEWKRIAAAVYAD